MYIENHERGAQNMNVVRIILLFFGTAGIMLVLTAGIGLPLSCLADMTAQKRAKEIREKDGDKAEEAYWNGYASRSSRIVRIAFFGLYFLFFALLCVISYVRGELI